MWDAQSNIKETGLSDILSLSSPSTRTDGMASDLAPTLVIPSIDARRATVILCHGLGQTNAAWEATIAKSLVPQLPEVGWILPKAPNRPVSWNQGTIRPSWFDIWNLPPHPSEYDEHVIRQSISTIEELIKEQILSGTDAKSIFLMGFSQGAALSICVALSSQWDLGGIIALSGWLPEAHRKNFLSPPSLPILWCHGTNDMEIPISYGRDAEAYIKALPHKADSRSIEVTFKTYAGLEHTTNDAELEDVAAFLKAARIHP